MTFGLHPLLHKSCGFLPSAWKRWKDMGPYSFFSIIRHLLRARSISSLILLHSCDHWPLFWSKFHERAGSQSITNRFIGSPHGLYQPRERRDPQILYVYPIVLDHTWRQASIKMLQQLDSSNPEFSRGISSYGCPGVLLDIGAFVRSFDANELSVDRDTCAPSHAPSLASYYIPSLSLVCQ